MLGYTLKSLDLVRAFPKLERLWIGFGSVPDIAPVGDLQKLKALKLLRVRRLADLSPLSKVTTLQYLALGDMKGIVALPDCSRLTALRRVYLDTMNGITDLSGLTRATNLDDLIVVESRIEADVFAPIIAAKRPKRVTVGLASRSAEKEVESKLGKRAVSVFGTPNQRMALK